MSVSGNLAAEARRAWIRDTLERTGTVQIGEAARHLGVSDMTIRRDLGELEAAGLARRVRGGAVFAGPQTFGDRHRQQPRAKARIAAKLRPLVPPRGAVGIDASSTMLRLASAIDAAEDLTVVTNGPDAFRVLQGRAGLTAQLTGGRLDARTGSLVGPLACHAAGTIVLDTLFVSAAAVHPLHGASEAALEEAEVKWALRQSAQRVVLAVDSSKLGQRAVALALKWPDVDLLVTELDPADHRLDPYRERVRLA